MNKVKLHPKEGVTYCIKLFMRVQTQPKIDNGKKIHNLENGKYIGNRPVKEHQHNRVVFKDEYYIFKYGNFCSLRCCNHANSTTNANYN